ncbi:MAG: hypothetical protein K6G82_06630 [Ruminococcus sp.]|nr:hypothetical protein [Ruminococcus sp.]
MGKKISWEDAEKLGKRDEEKESIFAKPNKYGYKINISHPKINPMYERYKDKLGERILSDTQRFAFEMAVFQMIERRKKSNEQGDSDRQADG